MEPMNRFGQKIPDETFEQMRSIAGDLKEMGYRESEKKPNLFYRPHSTEQFTVVFFADLRGTKAVDIWEDIRPLFYWSFEPDDARYGKDLRRRVAIYEWQRLADIPKKLSTKRKLSLTGKGGIKILAAENMIRTDSQGLNQHCESSPDRIANYMAKRG